MKTLTLFLGVLFVAGSTNINTMIPKDKCTSNCVVVLK